MWIGLDIFAYFFLQCECFFTRYYIADDRYASFFMFIKKMLGRLVDIFEFNLRNDSRA